MKKIFLIALPFFMACNTATQSNETPANKPATEKPVTPQQEEQPVATQASYAPKLPALKWNGIKEMTDATFKSQVLSSSTITLVDFNATWCGPCRQLKPVLAKLVKEYEGKINFASVDVDNCPEAANQYHVSSIPTLAFYQNGQQGKTTVGVSQQPYEDLKAMIESHLK